jgi:hypothetical protein
MFSVAAHVHVKEYFSHAKGREPFVSAFSLFIDFVSSEKAFPDPIVDFYFNGLNISLKAMAWLESSLSRPSTLF